MCGSRGALSVPLLVSSIHGGAHVERDERAPGTDTTTNRRSPPSRTLLRGDRKEPTVASSLFLSLSLSTHPFFNQPNYCPIDIDVSDRITPTGPLGQRYEFSDPFFLSFLLLQLPLVAINPFVGRKGKRVRGKREFEGRFLVDEKIFSFVNWTYLLLLD